jgi:hypothetical protein
MGNQSKYYHRSSGKASDMKSFRDYLSEAELTEGNPAVGDIFELEIARDETLIETYIVDVFEDGIVLEADDAMMRILMHAGYITENPTNMPPATQTISPLHSNVNKDKSADDDLENKYMDKDTGATAPKKPTRNPVDTSPLTEPKVKKDPKDYMAKEGYEDETMMSVYQDHKTTQKDGKVSSDFTSKSFARNPATGTGSYLMSRDKDGEVTQDFQQNVSKPWMDYTEKGGQGPMSQFRAPTNEAKYRGRTVPLGKKMAGDVKKSKVYVRGPKGNVVKVNFGDPNMTIKKSNPARRKSFRARHNCANPGPRWKARYWSCRSW